jgi:hypothetical protein
MFRMSRRRFTIGSLAASTAGICILSLVWPGARAAHGFIDLQAVPTACCVRSTAHMPTAAGTDHPVAALCGGDRLTGCGGGDDAGTGAQVEELVAGDVPIAMRAALGETAGLQARGPAARSSNQGSGSLNDGRRADGPAGPHGAGFAAPVRLAAADDAASEGDPSGKTPEKSTASPPAADDDGFSGSTKPASPDLTTTEEKALIENGWK